MLIHLNSFLISHPHSLCPLLLLPFSSSLILILEFRSGSPEGEQRMDDEVCYVHCVYWVNCFYCVYCVFDFMTYLYSDELYCPRFLHQCLISISCLCQCLCVSIYPPSHPYPYPCHSMPWQRTVLHCAALMHIWRAHHTKRTVLYINISSHCTIPYYITPHHTALPYTTLHYIYILHYIPFHCTVELICALSGWRKKASSSSDATTGQYHAHSCIHAHTYMYIRKCTCTQTYMLLHVYA